MNTKNKKIIVANWKMNFTMQEASLYLNQLDNLVQPHRSVEVVLAPALFTLQTLSLQVNRRQFRLAAQNFYWRDFGTFTGEVSIAQLRDIVDYAIIGHSERRYIFNESERDIRAKVQAALRSKVKPILCVGETAVDQANGETKEALADQIKSGLANIVNSDLENCVIAYEPVWAIGTGNPATLNTVARGINIIKEQLSYLFGEKDAALVRIIYGGSINETNVNQFLQIKGIDGLMLGSASLNPYEFNNIIQQTYNSTKTLTKTRGVL